MGVGRNVFLVWGLVAQGAWGTVKIIVATLKIILNTLSLAMNQENSSSENLICVYCGGEGTTYDHIPPKNLFKRPRPLLITVPACQPCNAGASQDDEYLRIFLLSDNRVQEHQEAQSLMGAYRRSLQRPSATGLGISTLRNLRRFPLITETGIYYGQGTELRYDFNRISKVLTRIMKGLFYHEFQEVFPSDYLIEVYSTGTMNLRPEGINAGLEFIRHIKPENKRTIGEDVFSYGWGIADDDPNATYWYLGFFQALPFFVVTVPPNM